MDVVAGLMLMGRMVFGIVVFTVVAIGFNLADGAGLNEMAKGNRVEQIVHVHPRGDAQVDEYKDVEQLRHVHETKNINPEFTAVTTRIRGYARKLVRGRFATQRPQEC